MCWHIFSPFITKFTRNAECMFALSLAGPQPVPTVGHQHVMAHGSPLPQKHSSPPGEDYKFFTRVLITFPIIYSSDAYTHTSQDNRLPEAGPPCSVQLCSWAALFADGGQAHSCFNTAVSMWILRKAGFVRHGVRRENRIISRRARTPCVRVTRWILFKRLTEVQVLLKEGKRDVLFHLGSG